MRYALCCAGMLFIAVCFALGLGVIIGLIDKDQEPTP